MWMFIGALVHQLLVASEAIFSASQFTLFQIDPLNESTNVFCVLAPPRPIHVLSHCLFWVKQNRKKSWFRTFRSSWLSMGLLAPPLEPNRWFSKSAQISVCFRTTIPRTLKAFWASHQSFLAPTWILPRDLGVSMLDNTWCTPQSMGKWNPTYFLKTNRFGGWK